MNTSISSFSLGHAYIAAPRMGIARFNHARSCWQGDTGRYWGQKRLKSDENANKAPGIQSTRANPLQLLPRPLGTPEKPRWTPLSKEEKREQFLDENKRQERKDILMKLNSEAYYADVHKMSFHGGKMWIAPDHLIREERSLYFPDLSGKTLSASPPELDLSLSAEARRSILMERGPWVPTSDGKGHTAQMVQGNVSIVAITHSQISEEHVKAWTQDVVERWRGHERFRFIHVNLQQNPLRTFLVSLFTSRLRREVPSYFHQTYILSYDNIDYIRDAMGLQNKFVGYVYLVDWLGRIRWAGCGGPWNGDGGARSLAHGDNNMPDIVDDSEKTNATALPQPEGGRSGQISEGMVQGLGEVQRLNRCLSVLMSRLEQLTQAGEKH